MRARPGLVFEDPTGTRLLYDAGRTVAGEEDARLGRIDVVLVSHMHGDHVGNRAKIVTGSEMPKFFAAKLEQAGGDPKDSMLGRFGASRQIGGVTITTVPATHSNGIAPEFVGDKLGTMLEAAGPPSGRRDFPDSR